DDDEDDPEQRADRETAARTGSPPRGLDGHVWHDDAAPFRDAVDERGRSREQALAVAALAELRPDDVANFAGEAVRDDALEAVADLDAERAILHGDDDEDAVVLALVADAASAVLEHLDGVLVDAAVRLERRHGGDDDGVAGGVAQRADAAIELGPARRIDDVREVVHRVRQRRYRLGADAVNAQQPIPDSQAEHKCNHEATWQLEVGRWALTRSRHRDHPSTYSQIFCAASRYREKRWLGSVTVDCSPDEEASTSRTTPLLTPIRASAVVASVSSERPDAAPAAPGESGSRAMLESRARRGAAEAATMFAMRVASPCDSRYASRR